MQQKSGGLSMGELMKLVDEYLHKEPYNLQEIAGCEKIFFPVSFLIMLSFLSFFLTFYFCLRLLEMDIEEVKKEYLGRIVVPAGAEGAGGTAFHLHHRAYHVYSETKRVEDFKKTCDSTDQDNESKIAVRVLFPFVFPFFV